MLCSRSRALVELRKMILSMEEKIAFRLFRADGNSKITAIFSSNDSEGRQKRLSKLHPRYFLRGSGCLLFLRFLKKQTLLGLIFLFLLKVLKIIPHFNQPLGFSVERFSEDSHLCQPMIQTAREQHIISRG